ncbi:VOC family protein [Staphylococcus caeli]|uniref:Methylmalonyl-CoA epimerase n=1 Tax=Staphylococcus caeli TaxID=2201815 RepID=A0A1D4K324_9STAP|nr:VOC family protein [Staphylococcus caeli]SCS68358.1 methylmalonyl-CoA epimerase [Staphylococcus caeli]SCT48728.1 methylmalonyl-CoA epimerase [Staphylococcus caeli]
MKIYGLAHIAIMAEHYDETIEFYTSLLDFTKAHSWSLPAYTIKEACMLKSRDQRTYIEVFDKNADVPREGNVLKSLHENVHGHILHFALTVDSVTEVVEHLQRNGVTIINPEESLALGSPAINVKNAIIKGPNGEIIELLEGVEF